MSKCGYNPLAHSTSQSASPATVWWPTGQIAIALTFFPAH